MKRALFATLLALATAASLSAAPDFKAILKSVDDMQDYGKSDFSATYSIVTQKVGENASANEIQIFRRDEMDQIVILINKPEKQKGQGYLKIDDNVWFYDPESGNFSHSTMKENIQNSEAKNSDFKKYTFSDDYEIASTAEGKLGAFATWILDLKARNNEVSYQRIKLTVRQDRAVPLKEEDFAVSGKLMRTVLFVPKYVTVAGKMIPTEIRMVDETTRVDPSDPKSPVNTSVLTISNPSVAPLADSTFSKSFLSRAQ